MILVHDGYVVGGPSLATDRAPLSAGAPAAGGDNLLMETGDNLLLETGDQILLE